MLNCGHMNTKIFSFESSIPSSVYQCTEEINLEFNLLLEMETTLNILERF